MSSANVSVITSDMSSSLASSTSLNTTSSSDQINSINTIVAKLGHELAEIRTRALENLMSKLENHVINELDLVQHKQLFIKLFELFNFPQFHQHDCVLNLLFNLAKHKSAAKNIQDISGLQFLNALLNDVKENNDTNKVTKINQIIERLISTLSIANNIQNNSASSQASGDQTNNSMHSSCSSLTSTLKSTTTTATDTNQTSSDIFSFKQPQSETTGSTTHSFLNSLNQLRIDNQQQFISNSISSFTDTRLSSFNDINLNSLKSMTISFDDMSANTRQNVMGNNHNNINNNDRGCSVDQGLGKIMVEAGAGQASPTFNWLPLTAMDRQFLKTAENSLKSNDPKKIKNYCTFLQTIVFSDFPAEIFLQRSFILKILIDLIIKSSTSMIDKQQQSNTHTDQSGHTNNETDNNNMALNKHLLFCIHFYCIKLKKRVDFIKTPSTFCDKDFYSNNFELYSRSIYSSRITPRHQTNSGTQSMRLNNNQASMGANQADHQLMNTSIYSTQSVLSSIDSTISSIASNQKMPATADTKPIKSKIQQSDKKLSLDLNGLDNSSASSTNQDLQISIDTILSETNQDNFETDVRDRVVIEKAENWPVYSFCFKLMDALVENLSVIIIRVNNNNRRTPGSVSDTSVVPTICETINNLIIILYETKTEWCNLNLNDVLMNLFKKLNFNMKYCNEKVQVSESDAGNQSVLVFNRLVYTYLIVTFYKFINLMNSSNETSLLMPGELSETIFLILNDICLLDSFTSISCILGTILNHIDPGLSEIYSLSNEICQSIRNACSFLLNHKQPYMTHEALIDMAKKSLNYMDYHKCKELPVSIIEFCSNLIASLDEERISGVSKDIEYLVTSCMMSKSAEVKVETYMTLLRLVNESLSVQIAVEINSKRYNKIRFLTLNKVFYQLVTFGMYDTNERVKRACEDILSHLLQCELLVSREFQQRLSQLITLYMPFIQTFGSQTNPLGQCILKMSDDILTPVHHLNDTQYDKDDSIQLMLDSPVERLRTSLRYLFAKDKALRKNGYYQAVGFLTKYHSHNAIESNETFIAEIDKHMMSKKRQAGSLTSAHSAFNLKDFYLRFSPDKFADMTVKLKRKGRNFSDNHNASVSNVFQTENLVRIYNIFASETVDLDVKQNAGEQLAIMLATGDQRLQSVFIGLDGMNYCIRYLRQTMLFKDQPNFAESLSCKFMFLSQVDKEGLSRLQASCIMAICHVLYWNREVRKLYLFDVEFYRLIFKALLVAYNLKSNQPDKTVQLYNSCQEDLSAILFIMLFNQVSRLDSYYEMQQHHQRLSSRQSDSKQFDLSHNLKNCLVEPFSLSSTKEPSHTELKLQEKQQWEAYELHYKLATLLKTKYGGAGLGDNSVLLGASQIKQILDKKFRLYWNFNWHGGSLLKMCEDLVYNPHLVESSSDSGLASFSEHLFLNDTDKFLIRHSNPYFLFKQMCERLLSCTSHQDALNLLDFLQILITIVDGNRLFNLGIDSRHNDLDETLSDEQTASKTDNEFYSQRTLSYFFDHERSDWHLALNRFASIMPSMKSKSDQLLFSNSIQTIGKMLQLQSQIYQNSQHTKTATPEPSVKGDRLSLVPTNSIAESHLMDKWLSELLHSPSSTLVQMFKQFLLNYESDELRINSYVMPLSDFIRVYFERLQVLGTHTNLEAILPAIELLEICTEQLQHCEVEKFRNLNKLAILVNLISSLLRTDFIHPADMDSEDSSKNKNLLVQLAKSLVQIINTFNIGRGGLSLSFMGNFITKSAHISLLKLVKDSIIISMSRENRLDIVKAVLCLKDHKNSLYGSSWLIPLMLHRESQIRSISFSLISLLVNEPLARGVLLTNQVGIWSIAFNVLLNCNECSIVRSQACAFLINLINCMNTNNSSIKGDASEPDGEPTNISLTSLQALLNEINFYQQVAFTLTSFYPYETYSLSDLKEKNDSFNDSEINSICSPLLVSSVAQLLYNLTVLMPDEAILMINNSGILSLLINYVKPINLLNKDNRYMENDRDWRLNEEIVDMLYMICRYLNMCCDLDSSCILMMFKDNSNLVYDLIECLNINAINKDKLKPFLSLLFGLFTKFLNYTDDRQLLENFLLTFTKTWQNITSYILTDILPKTSLPANNDSMGAKKAVSIIQYKNNSDTYFNLQSEESNSRLYDSSLQFYSCFLSKLTSLSEKSTRISGLVDNVTTIFDAANGTDDDEGTETCSLGSQLSQRLIKEFDKNFLVETNQNVKLIISNIMKALMSLSTSAKQTALNAGLVETLIEHLKYTHSKLNLKSLNTKGLLKENPCIMDLQQTLMILKHMMCHNSEIKQLISKSGLISAIHSFWCWAIQDQSLLRTTLSTLCTLTANNKLAVSLIAQSNISASSTSSVMNGSMSGLSLLHSIIKTLQKSYLNSHNKSLVIPKFAFSILANCAQSTECKSIFWKSNLLQDFTSVDFHASKAMSAKTGFKRETLWLNFLVSLSFTSEGQQLLLKTENLLSTLINLFDSYSNTTVESEVAYLSLLVLRNVAFNQSNKSKLIVQADYISTVIQQLRNKNDSFRLLAVSTLDSLLYDYQKAKVILKNSNVLKHLVDLNDFYARVISQRQGQDDNSQLIKTQAVVNNLIKILND